MAIGKTVFEVPEGAVLQIRDGRKVYRLTSGKRTLEEIASEIDALVPPEEREKLSGQDILDVIGTIRPAEAPRARLALTPIEAALVGRPVIDMMEADRRRYEQRALTRGGSVSVPGFGGNRRDRRAKAARER